ncbi:MAG: hypothetical protein J6W24_01540 [Prevotella sp.]|nr:hypothetical protein [Prevotella sp.]
MKVTANIYPIGYKTQGAVPLTMTADGWRAETKAYHHHKNQWDYCRPWIYMITLTCQPQEVGTVSCSAVVDSSAVSLQRKSQLDALYARKGRPHLFGELAREKKEGRAYIELNDFGKEAERLIYSIERYHPEIRILEQVVMPNHVHFVLHVRRRLPEKKPLGKIINGYKQAVNKAFKVHWLGVDENYVLPKGLLEGETYQPEHLGANYTRGKRGLVFERDYNERFLFHEGQLQAMLNYCRDNPERLAALRENPLYFERITNWHLPLPYLPAGGTKGQRQADISRLSNLLGVVPCSAVVPYSAMSLQSKEPSQQSTQPTPQHPQVLVTVNSIGNKALLREPEHIQIQCSRSMKPEEIDREAEDVLLLCKRGVVPVSPCISEGEKRIARAVLDAGYRLIVIFPDGIPADMPQYKPYGQYFDACKKGQLLILSPWQHPARDKQTKITRAECLFMNDLAAQIAAGGGSQIAAGGSPLLSSGTAEKEP